MASSYGPWVAGDDWRSWVEITKVSETDTTFNFKVRAWFQADAGSSTGSGNVQGWKGYKIGSGSDVWSSATNIDPFSSGSSKYFLESTYTSVQVTKTHSAQTVKGYADVEGKAGIYNGNKSQATASITVPAKTSRTISYNANGGSGAPASQTKWYGETLTLSSTKPTRTNYNFKGWATSSTATTAAYQAGANYTANPSSNVTLYAVWELAYVAPSLTISAYRSDSSGNRDNESTTHVTVEYSWSLNQTGGDNKSGTITINHGTSSADSVTISAASGSGKKTYTQTLAAGSTLTVSVTIKDAHNLTTTRSVTIGRVAKPFTMANGGMAAAFFGVAGATWNKILRVVGKLQVQDENISSTVTPSANTYGQGMYVCDSDGTDTAYTRLMKLTNGNQGLQLEAKRVVSGASKYNTLNMLLDNSGNQVVTVTNQKVWHKAISSWVQIASTTGTTAKTFSDLNAAGYSEVLVTVKYSTTFASSVVIPIAQLNSTATTWYFGGWYWSKAYFAYADMTLTKITPYKVKIDSVDQNGTWTVYAR